MMKRLLALAMFGLLLGGAVLAAPSAAQAATPQVVSGGPFQVWYECAPGGYCHTDLTCAEGTNYNSGFAINRLVAGALWVDNYCGVRVWLHQNTDWSGYNLCLSPNSGNVFLHRSYHNVYISSNPARC